MDKVSIVIPIYNVERYLEECVESVLRQTYDNLEVLLLDDGSPDRCPEICDELAAKDQRVKVRHLPNGGVSRARNLGIELAIGRWIMFLDSDDYLTEDAIESLVAAAAAAQCEAVCAGAYGFGKYRAATGCSGADRPEMVIHDERSSRAAVRTLLFNMWCGAGGFKKYAGVPWGKLFSASLLKDNAIAFPPDMYPDEDSLFNVYVCLHARSYAYIDIPVVYYRSRKSSVCASGGAKMLRNKLLFARRLLEVPGIEECFGEGELDELLVKSYLDGIVLLLRPGDGDVLLAAGEAAEVAVSEPFLSALAAAGPRMLAGEGAVPLAEERLGYLSLVLSGEFVQLAKRIKLANYKASIRPFVSSALHRNAPFD